MILLLLVNGISLCDVLFLGIMQIISSSFEIADWPSLGIKLLTGLTVSSFVLCIFVTFFMLVQVQDFGSACTSSWSLLIF